MTGYILQSLNKYEREQGPFGLGGELGENRTDTELDNESSPYRHWHLRRDEQGVDWLLLDHGDSNTNVLSRAVLEELNAILDRLVQNPPKALLIRSAKKDHFCVGADIKEFRHLTSEADVVEQVRAAHAVADRLADLRIPTLAVIHGNCFGGGLELALCCKYRIAVPGSKLGFPEIQLGLHPGLGGTARSTQLIDPLAAMEIMLTGKPVHDKKAKKLGLIDDLVPERHIANSVRALLNGSLEQHKPGLKAKLFNTGIARQQIAKKMRERAAAKLPLQHYPAPEALIQLWETHGDNSEAMRKAEIESFAHLMVSETARNLIRVFFLREKMKSLANLKHMANQKNLNSENETKHVHVIGAGIMGGDIAGWCAFEGMTVTLFDTDPAAIAQAVKRTAELCQQKHRSDAETREVLDRLIPDLHHNGLRRADIVIEAVPEDLDLKRKVYQEVESQLKPGALLATNTSSIPLTKLTEGLQDPSRFIGLHFFNPVAQMLLVEVVSHPQRSEQTLAKALAFTGQISRLPAPVTSAPGFLVNRALTPYLLEAIILFDQGLSAESIDKAAEEFGMPVGPIELADQIGLDICMGVADMLREQLPMEIPAIPQWLREKVAKGDVGKKSGRGFYVWKGDKPQKNSEVAKVPEGTVFRLILPMLNACMACLREGVIANEELLDGAMIFGTGFAPFRGGPMHYAHSLGFDTVASKLLLLEQHHGGRFKPDSGWTETPTPAAV